MVDWLIIWGAVEATGILVTPILQDLAKDSAKDYTKDFFKDCLKKVIRLPEKDVQKEAYGKALKEFLELVQQELEDAGYQAAQIKQYVSPLQRFIDNEKVAAILGQAFESGCRALETRVLAQTWLDLNLPNLAPEFDWDLVCKLYIRKVKTLVQQSDKLRPIFAAESQAMAADTLQELAGIVPDFDLGRYAEGLQEQYGNLKLESLDTTGVYYNELKLWKIFVPQNVRECQEFLPQIYEIPKEHLRRLRERGELDNAEMAVEELAHYRRVYVEQPIRSVLEVVGDPISLVRVNNPSPLQNVVILGDPGSGKSTLLQYLALVWAERPVSELPLYPVPLLIELRTYARDKQEKKCHDILSFIHSGNITCWLNQQQLHEKLRAGDAIALFDGIDEVFDPQLRDEVVTDIHRFTNDYAKVRTIATSRWLGYKAQRLRDAGFRHFMLQDLESEQIEKFIELWHDLTFQEGVNKSRKQTRLQKAIDDSQAIRELAGNPLLLTMMAILNRNQELPRDRFRLYERASEVLLYQWDVEAKLLEDPKLKDLKITIDYQDKQEMLRQVAYQMQASKQGLAGNLIDRVDLENILAQCLEPLVSSQARSVARLIIKQLRFRNFILCDLGANSFAFIHRTFLEYFCASEIKERFNKRDVEGGLTFEQLKNDVFGRHWWDESWHEVLRLIAGMIDPQFIEKIIVYLRWQPLVEKYYFSNLFLAADCLKEVKNRSEIQRTSKKLQEHIKWIIIYIDTYLDDDSNDIDEEKDEEDYDNHLYLTTHILNRVFTAIARTWQEEPSTYEWLQECAQNYRNEQERAAAIQAIAEYYCNNSRTPIFLKELIQKDRSEYVRGVAIWALAKNYTYASDTLSILQTLVKDEHESIKWTATKAIVRFFPTSSSCFESLYNFVTDYRFEWEEERQDNLKLALIALRVIVRNSMEEPKTLELLQNLAANATDEEIQDFAEDQLARLVQS